MHSQRLLVIITIVCVTKPRTNKSSRRRRYLFRRYSDEYRAKRISFRKSFTVPVHGTATYRV